MKNKSYKYRDTSERIVEYIRQKKLFPGSRLPSIRNLADSFDVSKNTIVKALEFLHDDNVIVIKEQTGAYVADFAWQSEKGFHEWQRFCENKSPMEKEFSSHFSNLSREQIITGTPRLSPEFNADSYLKLAMADVTDYIANNYTGGRLTLPHGVKRAVTFHLNNKGIHATADMISFSSGLNNSIQIITKTLLTRGMYLLIESPSQFNLYAHKIADEVGAEVVPISMDDDGIMLEELRNPKYKRRAVLLVSSVHQYPTGIHMSTQRKLDLLALCKDMQIPLVESDSYSDCFNISSIAAMDDKGVTIYCGSLKLSFALGLNIGWIVAPPHIKHRIEETKAKESMYPDCISSLIVRFLIEHGYYYDFLEQLAPIFRARKQLADSLLDSCFGAIVRYNKANSGFLYWLDFGKTDVKQYFSGSTALISYGQMFACKYKNFISFCPCALTEDQLVKFFNLKKLPQF